MGQIGPMVTPEIIVIPEEHPVHIPAEPSKPPTPAPEPVPEHIPA